MMRVVCISDTHNQHKSLTLPPGDILIHAGDVSVHGSVDEVESFFQWFGQQPFTYKVVIAGNHEWLFEREPDLARSLISKGVHYLQDSGVYIEGLLIWGSPWVSMSSRWAFHAEPGEDIAERWQQIPGDIDILITHAPPANTCLAEASPGNDVGCEELYYRVLQIKPRLHVFGHIHEGYGTDQWQINRADKQAKTSIIQLVNPAILDHQYRMVNKPIVIDMGWAGPPHEN